MRRLQRQLVTASPQRAELFSTFLAHAEGNAGTVALENPANAILGIVVVVSTQRSERGQLVFPRTAQ